MLCSIGARNPISCFLLFLPLCFQHIFCCSGVHWTRKVLTSELSCSKWEKLPGIQFLPEPSLEEGKTRSPLLCDCHANYKTYLYWRNFGCGWVIAVCQFPDTLKCETRGGNSLFFLDFRPSVDYGIPRPSSPHSLEYFLVTFLPWRIVASQARPTSWNTSIYIFTKTVTAEVQGTSFFYFLSLLRIIPLALNLQVHKKLSAKLQFPPSHPSQSLPDKWL